jgi:hypothetical protein
MPRPYGEKFLNNLSRSTEDRLGRELARLCVDASLSAAHIATAMEVSRTTVYSWFRGQGVREDRRRVVETLISLIKKDLERGRLPAVSVGDARRYISEMIDGTG